MMTVSELIAKLQEFDPNTIVVVNGYEGGFDNPLVTQNHALLDTNWNSAWYGRHDWDSEEDKIAVPVVVVGR